MKPHRWPAGLGNVHLRLVRQRVRDGNVGLLEELVRPPSGLVNRDVGEPWMYIGHLRRGSECAA